MLWDTTTENAELGKCKGERAMVHACAQPLLILERAFLSRS